MGQSVDTSEKVIIGIESKVDEPFSDSLEKIYSKHLKKDSNKNNRIDELCIALFGQKYNSDFSHIKYQLLTATGGLLAEGKRFDIPLEQQIISDFII